MSDEKPEKPEPKPAPESDGFVDPKTTAPAVQPEVMSAREYAEAYGIWSSRRPGRKQRFPYSIT
jgi:hypothetical protein